MATDKMIVERDGAVGRMIFNNPERHNAVSREMWEAVVEIMAGFATDPAVRVVVVSGAGGKAFVSGADISKFESERASQNAVDRYNAATHAATEALVNFAKPTLAMIDGYCIGGGMSLALACDMRMCSVGSQFGVPAAKLGLGYGADGVRRLMDLVGPAFTREIFYTARRYTAEEAFAMGLVNRVVPKADLAAQVKELVQSIADNAPLTVASIKKIVGELVKDPADRDMAACDRMVKACFASQDYIEGRRAFMEKRKAVFTGR
ncbi:MAG: enoyl-CoA hydratase [Rhodospirillales bacterium]|nr:enoyl-CoA hydratase [Rhodospirillales bacterium]